MAKSTTKKSATSPVSAKPVSMRAFSSELVLGALVAELLGSAVLVFAALMSANNPIIAALALLVGIMIFAEVSGGHLNPVVTVGAWATKQISWVKAVAYLVAQFVGAMLAYVIVAKFMKDTSVYTLFTKADDPSVLQGMSAARAPGEWKPIFGELVGSIVFSFGVASALLNKKVGLDRAFTMGGALLIGLIASLAGSYAVLNPAIAAAAGGFTSGGWWSTAAYGLVPLVGGVVGAWLFKLIKQDADTTQKTSAK